MMRNDDRKAGGDPDGIRVFDERPRRRTARVVTIAAVLALLVVLVAVLRREPAVAVDGMATLASHETANVAPKKVLRAPAPATPRRDVPVAAEPPPAKETRPSTARGSDDHSLEGLVRDAYDGLRQHGDGEGIAAFPPKGTNPPKTGLVVPDGFQLPEGYVRYYQTTDEGQRLEAILMFSPDYEFVDASGNPIELPANGIVPPEMAPPGLPVRMLEIPADPAPTRSQR